MLVYRKSFPYYVYSMNVGVNWTIERTNNLIMVPYGKNCLFFLCFLSMSNDMQ